MTPGVRRLAGFAAAVGVSSVAMVAWAVPAAAHTVTGVAPSDYRTEVLGVTPAVVGVTVRLLDLGRRVELTNRGPTEIVVLGYQNEPYLRVGPRGVYENRRAPALYLNRTPPPGVTATTLPAVADAQAAPEWHRVSGGRSVRWHDRRTRWEGGQPDAVRLHPGRTQAVSEWSLPLTDAGSGASVSVTGRITWVPRPNLALWLLVAAALVAVPLGAAATRWAGPLLACCVGVLLALDVVHTVGLAVATRDPAWKEALRVLFGSDSISVFAWIAGALAIGPLQRWREGGLVTAGIAALVIAILGGAADAGTLVHSQVAVAFSATLARAAVSTSLGLGLGLAAVTGLVERGLSQHNPALEARWGRMVRR
jgi:hypothetical protein